MTFPTEAARDDNLNSSDHGNNPSSSSKKKRRKSRDRKRKRRQEQNNMTDDDAVVTATQAPSSDASTEDHILRSNKKKKHKKSKKRSKKKLKTDKTGAHENSTDHEEDTSIPGDESGTSSPNLEGQMVGDTMVLIDRASGKIFSAFERLEESGDRKQIGTIQNGDIQLYSQQEDDLKRSNIQGMSTKDSDDNTT
jgi:hypothetical protein